MRTYILEGVVTALSSISHNGGERNGNVTQLRREKFVQPDGSVERVPVISGNAIRGILRDRGMFGMLKALGYGVNYETGEVLGLPLPAFYFLFSGGSLVSTGVEGLDIGKFRDMRQLIPLIGLFGGASGNVIMPGKLKIGKLLPICKETNHLLPTEFQNDQAASVWDYCQLEFYTRRDDEKNDRLRGMIETKKLTGDLFGVDKSTTSGPQQMMYECETIAAGTQFYWKVVLEDVTDVEFEAFLATVLEFSKSPTIGGKGGVGHGEISVRFDKWFEVDSRVAPKGAELDVKLGTKYQEHLSKHGQEIRNTLQEYA